VRVTRIAEATYRSFFGYRDAFPNPEQESSWAQSVWTMACSKTGTNISPPTGLKEMVSSHSASLPKLIFRRRTQLVSVGPRFHAAVKEKITPLVERHYGFQTSKAAESLGHNIDLAQALKADTAFSNGDDGQALPYRHRIIQQAINIIWFNDRSSDGIVFSNVFNPMPYEAIALVLAVVRHLSMIVTSNSCNTDHDGACFNANR